ncbi:hypothetical protein M1403_00035 [Patescibacteria group bacterium]|nr:hypothetical protein [Patescibacteria group bacterium]
MGQTFWTIFAGVTVFSLGQIFQNFFLKPLQTFQNVKGEIIHKVKFHSNVITNSGLDKEHLSWASGDMRDLSCQLETSYLLVPFTSVLSRFSLIPPRIDIREAARILILLSNAGGMPGNEEKNAKSIDKLKKLLKAEL